MNHILPYCLLFAATGFILSCAPQKENPDQMIAAAKALDQRFIEAYNKGDADAVMATYWNSPELVSYPPEAMEFRGWEEAKDGFVQAFANMPGVTLEIIESNYKAVGDVVIGWGKWRVSVPSPEGSPMEILGRYTVVKAERDGKWVYIMDHASVPLPTPPDHPAGQ